MKKVKQLGTMSSVTRKQNPLGVRTLNGVLKGMMKLRNDGTITLGSFIKEAGDIDPEKALEFLQNHRGGTVIVGRRGHPTRFVFGEALDKWVHQEEIRRQWRIRNNRNPETGTPLSDTPKRRGRPPGSTKRITNNTTVSDDNTGRGRGRPPGSKNKPVVTLDAGGGRQIRITGASVIGN